MSRQLTFVLGGKLYGKRVKRGIDAHAKLPTSPLYERFDLVFDRRDEPNLSLGDSQGRVGIKVLLEVLHGLIHAFDERVGEESFR